MKKLKASLEKRQKIKIEKQIEAKEEEIDRLNADKDELEA